MKVLNNQNTIANCTIFEQRMHFQKQFFLLKKTLSDIIDIYVHEWTNKSKVKNSLC